MCRCFAWCVCVCVQQYNQNIVVCSLHTTFPDSWKSWLNGICVGKGVYICSLPSDLSVSVRFMRKFSLDSEGGDKTGRGAKLAFLTGR